MARRTAADGRLRRGAGAAKRVLSRFLGGLFGWLVGLLILFEEWGWGPLSRALGRLSRLPVFAAIERFVERLPPYAALAVFFVPAIALLPIKMLALWLIAAGRPVLGVSVIVLAKLVGTAIVARLFLLTRPALMRLAWFARVYRRWTVVKDHWLARIRASAPWRIARRVKESWRDFRGR